jgi:hypothetical protein
MGEKRDIYGGKEKYDIYGGKEKCMESFGGEI